MDDTPNTAGNEPPTTGTGRETPAAAGQETPAAAGQETPNAAARTPNAAAGRAAPARTGRTRRLVVAGAGAAALLAGVLGTTIAVTTASADPTPPPAAAPARWGRPALPQQLRDDLRKVAAADPADRQAMLQGILQRAKDGTYGDRAKQIAERVEQRLSELPDQLKQDLATLIAAPDDQRAELRTQLRERAEAGEYGPQVQQWVKDFRPGWRGPFGPFGRR